MENNLIVVKQLPVIEENLRSMASMIDERVKKAKSLVCTEENLKEMRKIRSALNKEFGDFEQMRAVVRDEVLAPYNDFLAVYKECIGDKYAEADAALGKQINDASAEIKNNMRKELEEYFNEYRTSIGIGNFVSFSDTGINITLSSSKKGLRSTAKTYLDRIKSDLDLIETQGEYKDEILVEYEKNLDISKSITIVLERVKAVEAKRAIGTERSRKKKESNHIQVPLSLSAPIVEMPEKTYRFVFTVYGNMAKLKELKQFLDNGGYKYERNTDDRA